MEDDSAMSRADGIVLRVDALQLQRGDRVVLGGVSLEVSRGEIRIEHLTFTYGRADGRRVLDDLNLVVRPGERVGLVGRSGAGKSTLVNLLPRFLEPSAPWEARSAVPPVCSENSREAQAAEAAKAERRPSPS